MSDATKALNCPPEVLDIRPASAFPAVLLLSKPPTQMDPASRSVKMLQLQQRSSSILQRIKNFMPQMQESEVELQQKLRSTDQPEKLDIEYVEDGATAVEFNLALFEQSSGDTVSDSSSNSDSVSSDSDDQRLKLTTPIRKKNKISVFEENAPRPA